MKKERNRGVKSVLCLALSLAMILTLLSPELLTLQVQAETASDGSEEADYESQEASYASDEVIIVYYDEPLEESAADTSGDTSGEAADSADPDAESVLDEAGVTDQEVITSDETDGTVVLAQLDGSVSVEEAVDVIEADPAVDYVQPNYTYTLLTDEEDETAVEAETVASDASEDLQYYLYSSSFTDAWESVTVDGTVTVAVIDTGCDLDHEDLTDTVDTEHAYDVTSETLLTEADSDDSVGHGTYVCGVIAASAANGVGIAGASYNATILPVKVFDSNGSCSTSDLLAAYLYLDGLIDDGDVTNLKVINLSLGYYADDSSEATDQALETVISAMRTENGVLTICAGGNGTNGTANTSYCYPADFDVCVSVTAVTQDGENASFSDYNDAKDIAAYGVGIYTTKTGSRYTTVSGTSVASPQVAAAAALLWAADSSLTADEVVSILQETTDEVTGNVHEETADVGILNAAAAVESVLSLSEETNDETGTDSSDDADADEEDDADDLEDAQDIEDGITSWRYSDGQLITGADGTTGVNTLYTTDTNYPYSTWKKSYGTSYYGVVKSASSTTKISVSGVTSIIIDVSKWQGDIDWEEVAASGVTGAIIRCGGYTSSTSNGTTTYSYYDDPYFVDNIQEAIENGIQVGVYIYSTATTASKATKEAANVIRMIEEEAGLDPTDLDLPVYLDMEDSCQSSLTAAKRGTIAETFCDAVEAEGYTVGIYASQYWWSTYLTDDAFDNANWYKWVARYPTATSSSSQVKSCGVDDADMWQFTSHGVISGISANYVDVSFNYLETDGYITKPDQVTLKSATVSDDYDSVTLKWGKISNADGYRVYRKADGESSYTLVKTITSGSTVSWTDSTVESGTSYTYRVRAYRLKADGTTKLFGSYSSTKTVTTKPDQVVISETAMNAALTTIRITWDAVDSSITGYQVYRSTSGGSYTKIATVTGTSTLYYRDTGRSLGKTYKYKVRAYKTVTIQTEEEVTVTDESGNATTQTQTVTTSTNVYGSFSSAKSLTTKPSAVTISSASVVSSSGAVKVAWKKRSSATGYVIYRSTNGGSYKKVKTITKNTTLSWTDTSVKAGRVYRYKIRAYTKSGSTTVYSTSYSAVKKVTAKPAKVTISSITSTKSRSGTVKWKKVTNATGYQVAYRIKGTSKWYYTTVTTNKKVFTQLRNKKYYVKVRAYTKYGGTKYYGAWSSQKLMTVK